MTFWTFAAIAWIGVMTWKIVKLAIRNQRTFETDHIDLERETKIRFARDPNLGLDHILLAINFEPNSRHTYKYEALLLMARDELEKGAHNHAASIYANMRLQNQRFALLYAELSSTLEMLSLEEDKYLLDSAQACFDSYAKNRRDAITLLEDRIVNIRRLEGIYVDNEKMIKGLEDFLASAKRYLVKTKGDQTVDHITDFTGMENLEKVSALFEKVVSETEKEHQKADQKSKRSGGASKGKHSVPELTLEPNLSTKKPEEKIEGELQALASGR
ncbi:hypothetical protein IJ380_01090 [Candidatus Saccharibacteria bacterium]|nr:hypothetical protein [Candidatus Saccharibacteria bacterium]